MARVTGIGGVFLKSTGDRARLSAWYRDNLGLQLEEWGGAILKWPDDKAFAWVMDPDGNKVELWEPKIWDEKNKQP
jgi:hypothetical protein